MDCETIQQLNEEGLPYESNILFRYFMFFGPLPESWTEFIRTASDVAERMAVEQPECRFERWTADEAVHLTPTARDMIEKMTRLYPTKRTIIDEVLKHPGGDGQICLLPTVVDIHVLQNNRTSMKRFLPSLIIKLRCSLLSLC